jgi:hypothetical protein
VVVSEVEVVCVVVVTWRWLAEGHKLAEVEDAEKFVEPVGRAEAHPTKSSSMIPKIGVITQDQRNYENSGHTPKLLFRVVELKDMWK